MLYSVVLLTASAALASAQAWTYNSSTGVFTCPASNPNGAFCASDSMSSNIIIRCTNGIGHPGNCNDNLSGTQPTSLWYAPCWQTSQTSGDAACSKNCIVYGGSGNANGTFPVPGCTPSYTASTTSTSTSVSSSSATYTPVTTTSSTALSSSTSGSITITSTGTTTCVTDGTTTTQTFTTTYCPDTTLTTITTPPASETPSQGPTSAAYPTNGTVSTPVGTNTTATATATPVGPTASTPAVVTGGAVSNSAGAGLAAVGLFIAYFL